MVTDEAVSDEKVILIGVLITYLIEHSLVTDCIHNKLHSLTSHHHCMNIFS